MKVIVKKSETITDKARLFLCAKGSCGVNKHNQYYKTGDKNVLHINFYS